MKARMLQAFMTLLFVALMAPVTLAQGDGMRGERLLRELERTEDLIERARGVLVASDNPIAAQTLASAVDIQKKAREAFDNDMPLLSFSLTRKARELATKALAAARVSEQLEGVVLRKLERARELLDNARELLTDQENDNFQAIFESTENNLQRAWEFYRDRSFRPAARLADQVTRAARRMIVLFRAQEQNGSTFDHRAETVERLIAYAREVLTECDSPAGKQMLKQAEQARAMASDLAQRNQSEAALRALLRAKQAAQNAASACRRWSNLEQRYDRMKAEADRLNDMLQESDENETTEAAQLLIEQVNAQLELARRAISDQRLEQAQAALQAAHLALKQVQKYIGSGY